MVLIISLTGLVEMNSLCRKARFVPQDLDNQPKPQDPEILENRATARENRWDRDLKSTLVITESGRRSRNRS
jgi:hypothetical protein